MAGRGDSLQRIGLVPTHAEGFSPPPLREVPLRGAPSWLRACKPTPNGVDAMRAAAHPPWLASAPPRITRRVPTTSRET
jgi:hypothetical protein